MNLARATMNGKTVEMKAGELNDLKTMLKRANVKAILKEQLLKRVDWCIDQVVIQERNKDGK